MSRYIDADLIEYHEEYDGQGFTRAAYADDIENLPTADVRDDATAHKVVGGGERDGSTCWFECDNCGLAVDIGDVFCKHCGARFVP